MLTSKANHCLALACAGLLSGFLTCTSGHFLELFGTAFPSLVFFIGAIFGFVLVLYWRFFVALRSFWRSAAFILASTAAYFCAVDAGMSSPSYLYLFALGIDQQSAREFEICFAGGIVGGAIIFLAAVLFLPNRAHWRHVPLNLLAFCFPAGLLGILGWALGPYLGTGVWYVLRATHLAEHYQYAQTQPSGGANNYYSLFVVWQTGAALLLGLLLARPRPPLISFPEADQEAPLLSRS